MHCEMTDTVDITLFPWLLFRKFISGFNSTFLCNSVFGSVHFKV